MSTITYRVKGTAVVEVEGYVLHRDTTRADLFLVPSLASSR